MNDRTRLYAREPKLILIQITAENWWRRGESAYSEALKTRKLLIFRDAKNAQNGKIAPNWNVSGTRDFHFWHGEGEPVANVTENHILTSKNPETLVPTRLRLNTTRKTKDREGNPDNKKNKGKHTAKVTATEHCPRSSIVLVKGNRQKSRWFP